MSAEAPRGPGTLARLLTRLPGVVWVPPTRDRGRRSTEEKSPRPHVARAELVLARESHYALARLPLTMDPLQEIASALTGLSNTPGETFELHLDLLPISARQQQQIKTMQLRADAAEHSHRGGAGGWREQLRMIAYGAPAGRSAGRAGRFTSPPATPLQRLDTLRRARDLGGKIFAVEESWWRVQVLLRATSPQSGRAEHRLQQVIAALEQFADENHWRVHGHRIGPLYLGSNLPGRAHLFDRRVATGLFQPAKSGWVTTSEIAGLLKPPTIHCTAPNVARGGGPVPPPPPGLPTYHGPQDRDLLPQGWIRDDRGYGWRPVGVPLADTFFQLLPGRSRWGKTERMIVQLIHLAQTGRGCMYLDPHVQAIERIKPYLGAVADRIYEFNLSTRQTSRQAGFNLLSMTGRHKADIEGRIAAVVSAFSAALGWSTINNRAQNLVTQSVWSLCSIGLNLPPDLQPTIFQITTILSDEEWRAAILPHLAKDVAGFWNNRFGNLEKSAITPVTNLLDRLRSSPAVAALLGSPQSTYDARRAMDEGKIILASPAGTGDKDKFLAAFFLYDVFLAALSRQDTGLPMDQLRSFWLMVDEMQLYDTAGAVLEQMLRECAKYGLRVFGATQSLSVLRKPTQDMWLTNRSHLVATADRHDGAKIIAKEMGDKVEPTTITALERYTAVAQVTLDKKLTNPFWLRGFDVTDVYADLYDENAPATIARAVDANLGRKPVEQTLAELHDLDDRIAGYLLAHTPRARIDLPTAPPPAPPSVHRTEDSPPPHDGAAPQGPAGPDPGDDDTRPSVEPTESRDQPDSPSTPPSADAADGRAMADGITLPDNVRSLRRRPGTRSV